MGARAAGALCDLRDGLGLPLWREMFAAFGTAASNIFRLCGGGPAAAVS